MDNRYHKRLTNYLSQPKSVLYRNSSQSSYLAAAKSNYLRNPTQATNLMGPSLYPSQYTLLPNYAPYCQKCQIQRSKNKMICAHDRAFTFNKGLQNKKIQENAIINSQYFGPEIKTIKNTLIDIRDEMRQRDSRNQYNQITKNTQKFSNTYTKQSKLQLNNEYQRQINTKLQQKTKIINQLQRKIDEMQKFILKLQGKNKQLQQDINGLYNKIDKYELQIELQRGRANGLQNEKNQTQQRERILQIKVMDLRAELMRLQQMLRQQSLNEQQNRLFENLKKLGMRPSQQTNLMVNLDGHKQSRSTQTNLTQVDIESGQRELNRMQDILCDKINGNLKIQKKIFSRIEQIEHKLRFAYDKIYEVKQESLKMGINLGLNNL